MEIQPWNENKFMVAIGHTQTLKLMCEYLDDIKPPWDERMCAIAALQGQGKILKWIHFKAPSLCPWDETVCSNAATGGHLELLKWLRSPNLPGGPAPWNSKTCENAAGEGNLEILKWALEDAIPACKWSKKIPNRAIKNGRFKVVEWLYNKKYPWHANKLERLAKREYSKELRRKGCTKLYYSLQKIINWMGEHYYRPITMLNPIYE